ncbi:Crp/Fnr family transcriptional regulator [Acuticoccus kandeliae]|uniref:Crp/Fnr family transcriptional regulator n=1 Tax=Acuticoccus kandeliae TaxID=2073160 RepID=UPI000D3E520B|nr:Crp/Fnr family transcriptional regulator [Acuticoccus kandeliae]
MDVPYSPLHRLLESSASITDKEAHFFRDLHRRRRTVPPGAELIREGYPSSTVYVVAEGWACIFQALPNGNRQIIDVRLPGDIFGLSTLMRDTAHYSAESLTALEVSEISRAELLHITRRLPRIREHLFQIYARDEAILFDHMTIIGRRHAVSRVAHFALELGERLAAATLADPLQYSCPLDQAHFADALGMSAIYVNRCLRTLRERDLMRFHSREIIIDNHIGMLRLTDFDGSYTQLPTFRKDYDGAHRRASTPFDNAN